MLGLSQILTNRCKNLWKTGSLYRAIPETGATNYECRFTFLLLAHPLIMSYIRTKFHGNNFYGFKSTNQGGRNLQRGIIPCVKTVGGVMVLFSAHCLIMMYICIMFHENI